jgi:hAT family C-terminal dimerisation region
LHVVLPSPSVVTRWDSANLEVATLNRIMGDFNKALGLLIDGVDKKSLLKVGANGQTIPRENYIFSKDERTILRQYECGSEPCLLLSKFFQLNESTCHETLFVITARIAQMRETSFAMYGDISHSEVARDLRKRTKTLVVNSPNNILSVDEENEKTMEPCILKFRELYADDLENRIGLTEGPGERAHKLPVIIGLAALLNPLYGGRANITKSGLMDNQQYDKAEEDLLARMQLMRERETGNILPIELTSEDSDSDCMDDPVMRSLSTEREKAKEEFRIFCNLCKMQRNRPKTYIGETLKLGPYDMRYPITMGRVGIRGDDIIANPPFVNCNLADFIHDDGRFNLVEFFKMQKVLLPTLYKLSVCLASIRTNEVGCERFFSTAGYVSCPRRTSLNVRNYECLATLRSNMQNVYIDEDWVVRQYMTMEKAKSWDELQSIDDMNVLNLERQLLAESLGVNTDSLPPIDDPEPNNPNPNPNANVEN